MPNYNLIDPLPTPPVTDIQGGTTLVFPISIPTTGKMELFLEQLEMRPDFTLRAWISTEPLNNYVMPDDGPKNFFIPRSQIRIWLYDGIKLPPTKTAAGYYLMYTLVPNTTYYLNVSNLENFGNRFDIALLKPISPSKETYEEVVIEKKPVIPSPFNTQTMVFPKQ
jgi:hypothetical protein